MLKSIAAGLVGFVALMVLPVVPGALLRSAGPSEGPSIALQCAACVRSILLNLVPGVLAAMWLPAPRNLGLGIAVGLLAGVAAAVAYSISLLAVIVILGGSPVAYELAFMSLGYAPIIVGLSTLGGALFAAFRKGQAAPSAGPLL